MVSKGLENIARTFVVAALAALVQSGGVNADDTEIYQTTASSIDARPQVLIIFDDSGSMSSPVTGQRPPYNPAETSYTYDGTSTHPDNRVYWSTDGSPPGVNSDSYFLAGSNRCVTSYNSLQNSGFFQSTAARWSVMGGIARWTPLLSGNNPLHVECAADVTNSNSGNGPGVIAGYPQDVDTNGQEYGPDRDPNWQPGTAYTFYSAQYMDWYYDASLIEDRTRLQIAQEVVSSLVEANTAIDFGIALFNMNGGAGGDDENARWNGGRIVQRLIPDMTGPDRTNLTALVNGTTASGATPLCETTMEAYRYLSGDAVVYGNQRRATPIDSTDPDSPLWDPQPKDALAESGGTYDAPVAGCTYTYVILMTDGRPFNDSDANAAIESLTGKSCQDYETDEGGVGVYKKNCLPEIAEYMANYDLDGDSSNGDQFGITYTIGFTTDQLLLSDAADKGKGQYFTADDADGLAAAFQGAILDILSTDTTFTSPAAAVDTFTRTQSRNEVFFAMFKPDSRVDWPGNIKRLNIDFSSGDAVLVDKNGAAAIETSSGQIKATAITEWGSSQDGPAVLEGGVGALLAARNPATRTLFSNTGTNDALQAYDSNNMTPAAFGLTNDQLLYAFFGVASQAEFLAALSWGEGYDTGDVDGDNDFTEARPWILGDMLHSKPLVVNYGVRTSSFTPENPDLRIVAGTNAGFLHMFGNSDGEEDWAFFAKELAPLLNIRRINAVSSQHPYGIDAPAVLYTLDVDKDGDIKSTDGDKAYLYFGLRRGGRNLYALDISNPDSPSMLWRKDATSAGFAELGQTWSVPLITTIPGYVDRQGVPKPVLVFGAGYDTNKDSQGLATPDAMGRGIFIVDAATGDLVWSVTPAANTVTNLQEVALQHSVPAGVTVLDSNGDGRTDRIYFADTGGQLWRVDLPGATLPTIRQDTWRIVKVAGVNGGTRATDRRFFNAPDVVRSAYSGAAFDAILIGSGDRTNPNDMDDPNDPDLVAVNNQFYMFRDKAINPYFTAAPTTTECNATPPSVDFRCQLPLDPNDLYDVTSNDIQLGTPAEQAAAQAALASADGWRLDLQADGEKALARSITINGKVFFTTFSPDSGTVNVCEPVPGIGRLYVVDLYDASAEEDFDSNGNTERSWIIGALLPDTPSPHFGEDGVIRLLLPPGSGGGGEILSPFLTGGSVPQPRGTYWFREEY